MPLSMTAPRLVRQLESVLPRRQVSYPKMSAIEREKAGAAATAAAGGGLRAAMIMMINPAAVLKRRMAAVSPVLALSISGLAFTLFFLQTGLDLSRNGSPQSTAYILVVAGATYGTAAVSLIATLAWLQTQLFGCEKTLGWSIKAFALGYSPSLIYASFGLVANLAFGLNTAVAFGVTGMLWALGPMVSTIREMTGQRMGTSIVLATFSGGLLLYGWWLLSILVGG